MGVDVFGLCFYCDCDCIGVWGVGGECIGVYYWFWCCWNFECDELVGLVVELEVWFVWFEGEGYYIGGFWCDGDVFE